MKLLKIFLAVTITLIFIPSQVSAEKIEKIQGAIYSDNLPVMVRERMESTIESIGLQLFDGMDLTNANDNRLTYERTIQTVFDKILMGYSVDRVQIDFDTITVIHAFLTPWDNRIETVDIDINLWSVDSRIGELLKKDLSGVDEIFRSGLIGLPIGAIDWSSGVLKNRIDAFVRHRVPEYELTFEVEPEKNSTVKIEIRPVYPIIRKIDLRSESKTLPNFLLDRHRKITKDRLDILINLPTNFVIRHRKDIEKIIDDYLESEKEFRSMNLESEISIRRAEGEKVFVKTETDSARYDMNVEFWADLGRARNDKTDMNIRIDLGKKLSTTDKIFVLTDLKPRNMRWDFSAGYGKNLNEDLYLFARYCVPQTKAIFGASYDFFKDWRIRYEYQTDISTGEGALMYKMNRYFGIEYVLRTRENWIRLIGRF